MTLVTTYPEPVNGEHMSYVYDSEGSTVQGSRHFVTCGQATMSLSYAVDRRSVERVPLAMPEVDWLISQRDRVMRDIRGGRIPRR